MSYLYYNWKCCVAEPYMNVRKIFPTQQQDIKLIVGNAKKDPNILKIIIFGSSVTSACNPWSDIDVYFEMKEEKKMPYIKTENPQDRWNNFMVDWDLLTEIKNKGVVVYVRDFTG